MLLTPDQHAQLTAPPVSHRQANVQVLGQRQFYWEWGVIPYEMAPGFSDAERQRIRAAMDVWQRVAPVLFVPRTTQSGFLAVTRTRSPIRRRPHRASRRSVTDWAR